MQTERHTDADGVVIETTDAGRRATVQYGYSLKSFGHGPEATITMQVALPIDADDDAVQQEVKVASQQVRARVFDALDVPYEVNAEGVIVPDADAIAPPERDSKPRAKSGGGSKPRPKTDPEDMDKQVEQAWEDLLTNPEHWFDNTKDKKSPRAPDFRGKRNSGFDGFGLWISDNRGRTPEWVEAKYGI